jgi:hypothetical protein
MITINFTCHDKILELKMRLIGFIFLFLIIIISSPIYSIESEYQIKAIFLEQFSRFVEWPESMAAVDTSDDFIIGIIDDNPFESILEKTYANQRIKNRRVTIHYLSSIDEIENVQILFISESAQMILPEILSITRDKPILTIADTNGFGEDGVLINLYQLEGKIKFEINEKAVHESGLVVSYILFNLAKIVNPIRGEK